MNASVHSSAEADRVLWNRVVAGDGQAFQEVVSRYQGAIAAIGFNLVGDFAASQDIAQETFWNAWSTRDQLRDRTRLGAWLCSIARNLAHDWQKTHSRREWTRLESVAEPAANPADPLEETISAEEASIVWDALRDLPETYREVLVMYYRQGKSAAEVAHSLELSEDAVKQRLSRGRTLLREQVAALIEDVLVRTRPGRSFTSKVMAGIVGLSAVQSAATASAATVVSKVAGGAASGMAAAATKTIVATGFWGLLGGLVGAAGGLGGAYLGTWLPAELAPTNAERELLARAGAKQRLKAIVFSVVLIASGGFLFVNQGWIYFLAVTTVGSLAFIADTIISTLRLQRQVALLRQTRDPALDPNPSRVREYLSATIPIAGSEHWRGRSSTSRWRLFGLPLLDIQLTDPQQHFSGKPAQKTARGWIAVGDRADGLLLALGGRARGLIAIGGFACGGICLGGVSVGLVSIGGLSLGLLSIGGCSLGFNSIGGMAIGWHAAGGLAVGWHSAAGGFAVANHVAVGGYAIARDFIVGNGIAAQKNTLQAIQVADTESLRWVLDWLNKNFTWFIVGTLLISLAPTVAMLAFYRRNRVNKTQ